MVVAKRRAVGVHLLVTSVLTSASVLEDRRHSTNHAPVFVTRP